MTEVEKERAETRKNLNPYFLTKLVQTGNSDV
jgi:hypothetical protein